MQSANPLAFNPLVVTYDQDFYTWTQQMAMALRQKNWAALDIENLVEEIEALGKRDRRAIKSRLEILIMHLLKWQLQSSQRSRSWKSTVTEQRLRIQDLLTDSPSLKNYLFEILPEAYKNGRKLASDETGLTLDVFPETCLYSYEQLVEADDLFANEQTE